MPFVESKRTLIIGDQIFFNPRIGPFYCVYSEIKFGGRIVYSRTIEEVERAAEELLKFMDINKRKGDQCVLGLDIEWRPTFKKGNFICEKYKGE